MKSLIFKEKTMKALSLITLSLIIFSLAGKSDMDEEQNQSNICIEMIDLYDKSNGQLGWPKEACK